MNTAVAEGKGAPETAPTLPGAPEGIFVADESKLVHTWVPKVKSPGKDYSRHEVYLKTNPKGVLRRFMHLRPIVRTVMLESGKPLPVYALHGGATIVIEVDYNKQIVQAGLSLVHLGGNTDKTSGKVVKPDNYCRRIGRYEAVERIMDSKVWSARTDQLKHSYLELPISYFQEAIEEVMPEMQADIDEVLRIYGLYKAIDLHTLPSSLKLCDISNVAIQVIVIDAFAKNFKQIKNYF